MDRGGLRARTKSAIVRGYVEESIFDEEDHGLRPSRYGFVECGSFSSSAADLYRRHFYSEPLPRIPDTLNERSILLKFRSSTEQPDHYEFPAPSSARSSRRFAPMNVIAECHSSVVPSWSRPNTQIRTEADSIGDEQENHRCPYIVARFNASAAGEVTAMMTCGCSGASVATKEVRQ